MEQAFINLLTPIFDLFKEEIKQLIRNEMNNINTKEILFPKEAASFLNMKQDTLRTKARTGRIKGYKPDTTWYFYKKDLIDYIEEGSQLTLEEERKNVSEELKNRL